MGEQSDRAERIEETRAAIMDHLAALEELENTEEQRDELQEELDKVTRDLVRARSSVVVLLVVGFLLGAVVFWEWFFLSDVQGELEQERNRADQVRFAWEGEDGNMRYLFVPRELAGSIKIDPSK